VAVPLAPHVRPARPAHLVHPAEADAAVAETTDMRSRILMQFHITGRCNLRCKHCYREDGDVQPLSTDDVKNIIDQYTKLLRLYNGIHGIKRRGHINITGGEPFIREDIRDILMYLGEHRERFSYGVLSNGSFIDDGMIKVLRETGASFVQLSIDGDRETHDSLRASGDYDRVLRKAEYLEKNGIRTYISFTANRDNHKHLPKVAKECRKAGVTKLWSDRLVPIGGGSELRDIAITADNIEDYLGSLRRAKGNFLTRKIYSKTMVSSNRALQFLGTDGCPYHCSAGDTLITVDEFGNVMPCRRMPIVCGNALETSLASIYFGDDTFRTLRMEHIPKECEGCKHKSVCRGGAKCQSYAVYGDFGRRDPGCPVKI